MIRTVLIFGGLAGAFVIGVTRLGFTLTGGEADPSMVWLGFLTMIIGLSLIFLGVKRYRDSQCDGEISFWRAFGVGVAMAVVAGLVYVVAWEFHLAATNFAFIENYSSALIAKATQDDLPAEEIRQKIERIESSKESYYNPLFRIPITFSEIFPISVIIAAISAAVLRNPNVLPRTV